jgi:hypothetical protein
MADALTGQLSSMLTGLVPALKVFGIAFIAAIFVIAAGYYFLVIKKRKVWILNIYELKSDGRLHMVNKDVLQEKKFDQGRSTFYWLARARQETTPPPWEAVDRIGNKDYADYLKIRQSYIPILKQAMDTDLDRIGRINTKALLAIRGAKYKEPKSFDQLLSEKARKVESRFIYVPINKVPHINIGYNQMDYDVDVMRINQIDNIDKMFSSKKGFWEKYGSYIILGTLVVAVIVIGFLSFEYMRDVITQNLAQTNNVVEAIKNMKFTGGGIPVE